MWFHCLLSSALYQHILTPHQSLENSRIKVVFFLGRSIVHAIIYPTQILAVTIFQPCSSPVKACRRRLCHEWICQYTEVLFEQRICFASILVGCHRLVEELGTSGVNIKQPHYKITFQSPRWAMAMFLRKNKKLGYGTHKLHKICRELWLFSWSNFFNATSFPVAYAGNQLVLYIAVTVLYTTALNQYNDLNLARRFRIWIAFTFSLACNCFPFFLFFETSSLSLQLYWLTSSILLLLHFLLFLVPRIRRRQVKKRISATGCCNRTPRISDVPFFFGDMQNPGHRGQEEKDGVTRLFFSNEDVKGWRVG